MTTIEPSNQEPTTPTGPGHQIGLQHVMPGPAPKRKGPSWLTTPVIILTAVLIVLLGTIVALGIALGGDDPAGPPQAGPTQDEADEEPVSRPTRFEHNWATLDPEDVLVGVQITEKTCFGSAGCNVTFEPTVLLTSLTEQYEPGSKWSITYQVDGGEDPYISTIDLTFGQDNEGQISYDSFNLVQTARSSDELTAKVTNVRER